jgi:hypothetical protein
MPDRDVSCSVRTCPKCNFQAVVPDKREGGRSLRRRDRKYVRTVAKNLNLPFLDDGDVCPKCGNIAKELTDPLLSVKFNENATAEEVSNRVKPLMGEQIKSGD